MNENTKAAELFRNYYDYKRISEEAAKEVARLKSEILLILDGGGVNELTAGGYTAKQTTVKGRVGVDSKRLEKELPEIFLNYTKEGAPSVRLAVVKE